mmetsp:Transcript_38471/g.64723  ORF Transcript_38471/g.64723 Transcript_38471/m.64723 type:complete len:240 (-) Transcript_38471:3054-3773(-)
MRARFFSSRSTSNSSGWDVRGRSNSFSASTSSSLMAVFSSMISWNFLSSSTPRSRSMAGSPGPELLSSRSSSLLLAEKSSTCVMVISVNLSLTSSRLASTRSTSSSSSLYAWRMLRASLASSSSLGTAYRSRVRNRSSRSRYSSSTIMNCLRMVAMTLSTPLRSSRVEGSACRPTLASSIIARISFSFTRSRSAITFPMVCTHCRASSRTASTSEWLDTRTKSISRLRGIWKMSSLIFW